MQFLYFLVGTSLAFENNLELLQKQIDVVDFKVKDKHSLCFDNIDYKNNSGAITSYKKDFKSKHNSVLNTFKKQRDKYKECNFSYYGLYLFAKKDMNKNLINAIKKYDYVKHANYNYSIRDTDVSTKMTLSFVCIDCENSEKMIVKNINNFFINTCLTDKKDFYTKSQIDLIKDISNKASRTKNK